MADAAKEKALELIPLLEELQLLEVCDNLKLTLKTDLKVTRKQALKNKLIRYLASEEIEESDDGGLAVYTKLIDEMQALVAENELSDDDDTKRSGMGKSSKSGGRVGDPKTEPTDSSGGVSDQDAAQLKQVLEEMGLSSGTPKQVVIGALASLLKTGSEEGLDEDAMKKLGQVVGKAVKSEGSSTTTDSQVTRSRVVHRLKEFKIDGKIGHGDSPLTFQNIKYQIADAEGLEYQWKEIMSALIKAMKSGSSVRNYFETNPELKKEEFLEMLESLLEEEKSSSDLVLEMKSKVQKTDEKVEDYVLDMVNLKKQIVKESVVEGSPVGEELAWKWCSQAILEGLRHSAIRQEMRTILRKSSTQPVLMKEVKRLVKLEEQHQLKTGEEDGSSNANQKSKSSVKKNADVNHVTLPGSTYGNQNTQGDKKNAVRSNDAVTGVSGLDQLNAKLDLIVNQMVECVEVIPVVRGLEKDMKTLQKEMKEFKDKSGGGRRIPLKCEECKRNNAFCRHCANCGEDGHKLAQCLKPKNS